MPTQAQIPSDHLQPVVELARRAARFWRVGLSVLLVSLLATVAVARLRPRQYKSEAVLLYREGMQWNPNEASSTRRIGQRLKDMLLSRTQLANVIQELGLYPRLVQAGRVADAVEEMLLATTFKVTEGDIFLLSYIGDTPEEAQSVTARLTEVLIVENMRLRASQAEVAQAFLDAEKKRNEVELAVREAEQVRFLAKHPEFVHEQGTTGATFRTGAGVKPHGGDPVLSALRREEQRLRRQITSPGQVPPVPQDPVLVAARDEAVAKVMATKRELADRRARFTEQHPDVRSAIAMVNEAEDALRRATEAIDEKRSAAPPVDLQAQLAQVQKEIVAREKRPGSEAAEPSEADNPAQRIVALETEWARLSREVAEARERLQLLDTRQFGAAMTLSTLVSGQAAQIIVIDPAYAPARPIGMSLTRLLILGALASLTAGVGAAVALGLMDDRLHDAEDVERLELFPVLAEIELEGPPLERAQGSLRGGSPARSTPALARPISGTRALPPDVPAGGATAPGRAAQGALDAAEAGAAGVPGSDPVTPSVPLENGPSLRGASSSAAASLALVPPRAGGVTAEGAAVDLAAATSDVAEVVRVRRVESAPRADPRLLMLQAPDSPMAAGFRVLRHRLAGRTRGKAILVTSPSAGEGKTLCALNLALALGEGSGARVLLVEANFRAPSLSRLLGFDPPVCIGKQLEWFRARRVHAWDVAETLAPWLHTAIVARGAELRSITDGLALAAFVEDMRRAGYDHIVLDGPPALGSADVNVIEESVDGVLMVLRAGSTRTRDLRRSVEQIGRTKLLGVTLLRS